MIRCSAPRSQLWRRWSDGCRARYSLLTDRELFGEPALPCDARPSWSCHLACARKVRLCILCHLFDVFSLQSLVQFMVEQTLQDTMVNHYTSFSSIAQHVLCYVSVPCLILTWGLASSFGYCYYYFGFTSFSSIQFPLALISFCRIATACRCCRKITTEPKLTLLVPNKILRRSTHIS